MPVWMHEEAGARGGHRTISKLCNISLVRFEIADKMVKTAGKKGHIFCCIRNIQRSINALYYVKMKVTSFCKSKKLAS